MTNGRDDQMPRWLLALAIGLDFVPGLEVLVDHLALLRAHGVQRHRAPISKRGLGGLVGQRMQCGRAPPAIPRGVDAQRLAALQAMERDPVSQMLNRIERLPVMTDQDRKLIVVAEVLGADRILAILNLNLGFNAGGICDRLEDLSDVVERLLVHRRHQLSPST